MHDSWIARRGRVWLLVALLALVLIAALLLGRKPADSVAAEVRTNGALTAIPTHVQNWLFACVSSRDNCTGDQNIGISAGWTARHVDWNEVYYIAAADGTSAALAAAGAKHIVIYVDPNITPYCPIPDGYSVTSPDFPENGANCAGQVARALGPVDGSYAHGYLHQANGNRLIDRDDGAFRGEAQEPLYIGDPGVQRAFAEVTSQNPYATDVLEDDGGGAYNCIFDDNDRCDAGARFGGAHAAPPECDYRGGYWCFKYGETAREWDRAPDPEEAYLRDAIALSNHSRLPVIGNNGAATDSYDLQWVQAARVAGVMAEEAWTQKSSTSAWVAEANAILTYHRMGKYVVENDYDESRLFFQLASHWIVYDPKYSIEELAEVNPAVRSAGVRDTTFPEESVVPSQPLKTTPRDDDVTTFETSPGVFVREYATCYQSGRPIGRCAGVVNTGGTSSRITGLRRAYGHVLVHNTAATWAAGGQAQWSSAVPTWIGPNDGVILAQ